jgi:uncharacterized protein YukE
MSVLPDPADLAAIADRIAAHAAATRDRAARLDRAVAATGWTGVAAAVFHDEAQLATDTLRNAAARLDAAADALRRHAARIGTLIADIVHLGADEVGLMKDALTHPGQVLPDAVDVAGDGIHVLGDVAGGVVHGIGGVCHAIGF